MVSDDRTTSGLRRKRLFGLDFVDAQAVDDVVPEVLRLAARSVDELADDVLPIVVTPNVDHLVRLSKSPGGVADVLVSRAAIVLPDGQPIVWGSRLLGASLTARLPGSTLVAALVPVLVRDARRVLVVASSDGLSGRIERESDGFRSITAPLFGSDDAVAIAAFTDDVVRIGQEHRAEFVFVTLGHPKQEYIISGLVDRWPGHLPLPVMLAVGQSFDMYFGTVKRAPEWVQRAGLEWLFRFVKEPRRLFRRYFVDDLQFVVIFARQWRTHRRTIRSSAN